MSSTGAVKAADNLFGRCLADLVAGDMNAGERRVHARGEVRVVHPHKRNVVRETKAKRSAGQMRADGQRVPVEEDGAGRVWERALGS